jgi:hypothetical protein
VVCGQCAAAMLCANNTCVDNSCSSSNADGLCATDMVCYGGQCVNQSVADCANDPKCSTKNCDSGDCSKPGVWQRLISWLKGLIS